jgi:carbonic anhydrase/acetyltransferase-like protein (isoleucine patch superfamily)
MNIRNLGKRILHAGVPVPAPMRWILRGGYHAGSAVMEALRALKGWFLVVPMMRALCARTGRRLRMERLPYICGQGKISIGDNVYISGKIGITFFNRVPWLPEFSIGDRSFIGHECAFTAGRGIRIGNDCLLARGVMIADYDGHPLAPERRSESPSPEDMRPVVIEDHVWIAAHAIILKGVTIGRGSVVGAGAVVTADVPPRTVVAGNPARVIKTI